MVNPNIKIGSSTYNDIAMLTVDRVEGGTANYIYVNKHIKSGPKNVILRATPQGRAIVERPLNNITTNLSVGALPRRNATIIQNMNNVININIAKE